MKDFDTVERSRGRSRTRLRTLIKVTNKNDVGSRFQFARQQIAVGSDQWNMSRYEQEPEYTRHLFITNARVYINYDFYFHGRMDQLCQTLVSTTVSKVGAVSSAQIWLMASLWVESGCACCLLWCEFHLWRMGIVLICLCFWWPVSAAAFLRGNRVMVQPATNCSVALFIDSPLGLLLWSNSPNH